MTAEARRHLAFHMRRRWSIHITGATCVHSQRTLLLPLPEPSSDEAPASAKDRELLARIRLGDQPAFDQLFRESYEALVRSATRLLRDQAVAEEIVQDVMLELWRRRETLPEDVSPQGYLFRATRNRALNHLRHLKVKQRLASGMTAEPAEQASAPSTLITREMQAALVQGLATLPPRCREVFALSRERGLKYSEIADHMEISVKTVEAQMGKALRTLREHLAPWLPHSS